MAATPFAAELIATANAIATAGKGILAADESAGTIGKRFETIGAGSAGGCELTACRAPRAPPARATASSPPPPRPIVAAGVENNEENRRFYRQMLFETAGLNQYISGCIVFEETLFHKSDDGTPCVFPAPARVDSRGARGGDSRCATPLAPPHLCARAGWPRSCARRASSSASRSTRARWNWRARTARSSCRAWTTWPSAARSTTRRARALPSGACGRRGARCAAGARARARACCSPTALLPLHPPQARGHQHQAVWLSVGPGHPAERARPGAVRVHLPAERASAHCGARGADGRHAQH